MTVHELTQKQLEELRDSYFYLFYTVEMKDGIDSAEDIPMGNVKEHFEGVHFVDDDFFCSFNFSLTQNDK